MTIYELVSAVSNGSLDGELSRIYGSSDKEIMRQRARLLSAAERFSEHYPEDKSVHVFSAPGRTEIGGNHTDHQHGCVLAAAVTSDIIAIVSFNHSGIVRVKSEGHKEDVVYLDDLAPRNQEKGHGGAILRGILAKFAELGVNVWGFDAYTSSDVPSGCGMSSSAAFEVLIGTIIDKYYNGGELGAVETAKLCQFVENRYFGKGCGLMDQLVCAVGGFAAIDFKDPDKPVIRNISFDFLSSGYSLCIVDTQGDHGDLTDDYSEIPADMKTVAKAMGVKVLGDADEWDFYEKLPNLRDKCSDRALLRAAHFFGETRRAVEEADALERGDLGEFFKLVNDSGDSSAILLQNLFSPKDRDSQELLLAVHLSRRQLQGSGAARVHGGGFAGTVQAFVPTYAASGFKAEMERFFGEGSCRVVGIRPVGGIEIGIGQ